MAWEAFIVYRDLGPGRSIAKAGLKLGKTKTHLEDWSSKYRWVARCAAWDAEIDRDHRQALRAAQREMIAAHAGIALKLRTKAMLAFEEIAADKLGVFGVLQYLATAVKIEQTTLGMPTERTAVELSGADGDPLTVFFDNLPDSQLIDIAKATLQEIEGKPPKEIPNDPAKTPKP